MNVDIFLLLQCCFYLNIVACHAESEIKHGNICKQGNALKTKQIDENGNITFFYFTVRTP